ncbi:unnamed protein product [Sphagnum jensenii]|uniref:ACT domain-containing protein n=1 Tax=Sphagnum jensenii TaxID=128206 RepID=A0ABP0VPZ1_9BRYO
MGGAFAAGVAGNEIVNVRRGHHQGDPSELTINCPDKVGLGCDFARIVFEFGLSVVKGDFSTDGKWCFVVLWVVPRVRRPVQWSLLKRRIEEVCPSIETQFTPPLIPPVSSRKVLLLQVCSSDRTGLLNDVVQKLWELEFTIHKVKVSTSPDNKAINLFFVTDNQDTRDNRNKLPLKKRGEQVGDQLKDLLGSSFSYSDLSEASPEMADLSCAPLVHTVAKDLFADVISPTETENDRSRGGSHTSLGGEGTMVTIDNSISPVHSLLQVTCKSHKGLVYDCLRTLKDVNLQVAHGRVATLENGSTEINIFLLRTEGRKITDVEKQKLLCRCMHAEVQHPLRVVVVSRGPDTELLVATPIELCGRGRPRVLYDVTLALRELSICIFKADIGRHVVADRQWEIYRFLLIDRPDLSLTSSRIRSLIAERVQRILMG